MANIVEIRSNQDQNNFIHNNRKGILFFGSKFCGHCRNITPVFHKMVNEYPDVRFGHVEVTEVTVEGIEGVPVFVSYRNGVPVDMSVGDSESKLRRLIQDI